jgi:hypothetical protein
VDFNNRLLKSPIILGYVTPISQALNHAKKIIVECPVGKQLKVLQFNSAEPTLNYSRIEEAQ